MKTLKYIFSFALVFFISCADDDNDLSFIDKVTAPSDVAALFQMTQDNSGLVTITPNSVGAVFYNVTLGDATTEPEHVDQGESLTHVYAEGSYTVTIEAIGITGLKTELTKDLLVSFNAPENLVVTIENDPTISQQVNVTATADFAMLFEVDFGDDSDVVQANIGEVASHVYLETGLYTITVTAMGSAIETTTYTEVDFEVTAILQPLTAAPSQPSRQETDVVSIYSGVYMDMAGVDFYPNWGQSTTYTEIEIEGDNVIQYGNLNYQGIDFSGTPIDVSTMEFLHVDIWTADENNAKISPISSGPNEAAYDLDLTAQEWVSFDIPLSFFTDQNPLVDFADIIQFKFDGDPAGGTIFVDNLYFYKPSLDPFNDGLLTNGDFEAGSDSWIVGTDDNSPVTVVTDSGNTYYSANVAAAGNPWDVNMSQKVEIIQDETYTLIFDAWSDTNRSIISGIGLSADPWSSATETVNITTTRTTYSLTLVATGFAALDARVIFDLGAEAGMVNIDNVSLFLGDGPFDDGLLTNGDFEAGSNSWIVGTDDNSPVTVVTDAGNTYYSTTVAAAGNPWDVNMSQKVEITQGLIYTLTFDAWSDTNRSIVSGIGLSAAPWSSATEIVDITTARTTYTLTLTATDFGASDARVIFDLGADAGMVNIDNVSLTSN